MFELQAQYDARASFYGKARVELVDNGLILYSYGTKVCELDKDGNVIAIGIYSQTTSRHTKEFLKQFSNLSGKLLNLSIPQLVKQLNLAN